MNKESENLEPRTSNVELRIAAVFTLGSRFKVQGSKFKVEPAAIQQPVELTGFFSQIGGRP
jgi:hypothetical protein